MIFGLPRTMRVALFRSLRHGHTLPAAESFEDVGGYMRVSEYVQVEFLPIEPASRVTHQLAELDRLEAAIRAESDTRLADIRRLRSKLVPVDGAHGAVQEVAT